MTEAQKSTKDMEVTAVGDQERSENPPIRGQGVDVLIRVSEMSRRSKTFLYVSSVIKQQDAMNLYGL